MTHVVDIEYNNNGRVEIDVVYKGRNAGEIYKEVKDKIGKYPIDIESDDSVLAGEKMVVSIEGTVEDEKILRELKKEIDELF